MLLVYMLLTYWLFHEQRKRLRCSPIDSPNVENANQRSEGLYGKRTLMLESPEIISDLEILREHIGEQK